jgi:hypothetical protein
MVPKNKSRQVTGKSPEGHHDPEGSWKAAGRQLEGDRKASGRLSGLTKAPLRSPEDKSVQGTAPTSKKEGPHWELNPGPL